MIITPFIQSILVKVLQEYIGPLFRRVPRPKPHEPTEEKIDLWIQTVSSGDPEKLARLRAYQSELARIRSNSASPRKALENLGSILDEQIHTVDAAKALLVRSGNDLKTSCDQLKKIQASVDATVEEINSNILPT